MTATEEKRLLDKAQKGDMSAFEDLVRAHESFVYSIAYKMLGNVQDAEDAAQETFIKAYTSLAGFRGESKFSVWLYRLTGNVCVDMLRRRKDSVSLSIGDEDEDKTLDIPDERFQPETELEKKELRQAVQAGLQQLPEDFRTPLVLREMGGHSYEDIARALSLDIGTVKSRIFRGRKKLCAILTSTGNFFGERPSKSEKGGVQE